MGRRHARHSSPAHRVDEGFSIDFPEIKGKSSPRAPSISVAELRIVPAAWMKQPSPSGNWPPQTPLHRPEPPAPRRFPAKPPQAPPRIAMMGGIDESTWPFSRMGPTNFPPRFNMSFAHCPAQRLERPARSWPSTCLPPHPRPLFAPRHKIAKRFTSAAPRTSSNPLPTAKKPLNPPLTPPQHSPGKLSTKGTTLLLDTHPFPVSPRPHHFVYGHPPKNRRRTSRLPSLPKPLASAGALTTPA